MFENIGLQFWDKSIETVTTFVRLRGRFQFWRRRILVSHVVLRDGQSQV